MSRLTDGIESFNIDRQPFAVCPYCGHVDQRSWEIDCGPGLDGSTETSCGSCGKVYFVERRVTIYYTTRKLAEREKEG